MEEKSNKEINLIDIFIIIGNWIKKLYFALLKFIGNLIKLVFRHKILVGIILLLFFAFAIFNGKPSSRVYSAGAMGALYGVDAATVNEIIKPLQKLSPKFSADIYQINLHLGADLARKIIAVELFNVVDYKKDSIPDRVDFKGNHSLSDTVNVIMKDHVYIRVKTIGTENLNKVGNAVVDFINSNSIAQKRLKILQNSLTDQIKLCDNEMGRIDSVAKVTYFKEANENLRFSNDKLIVGEQYKQLFYRDLLYIQDLKSIAQRKLNDAQQPLVTPAGFSINTFPENGYVKNILVFLPIGFIIAAIIAYILENLKKWIKFANER